jgi:hypothetical protein
MRRGLTRLVLAGFVGCTPFSVAEVVAPADSGSMPTEAGAEAGPAPSDAGFRTIATINFDDIDAGSSWNGAAPSPSPFSPWAVLLTPQASLRIGSYEDAPSKLNVLNSFT